MMKKQNKYDYIILGSIFLLLITNIVLFLRMNQLQNAILSALTPYTIPVGLQTGAKSPLFTAESTDGDRISLQDLLTNSENKYVFLVFSSTTCSACQQFWPELKRFAENHPDLAIIMMSNGEQSENETMQKEQDFPFPIVAWDENVANEYKVPGTPYLYLLSRDQQVLFSGFADEIGDLERIINDPPA